MSQYQKIAQASCVINCTQISLMRLGRTVLQHQVDSTHGRGEEKQVWPFVELREGVLGLTVNLEREVTASFCNTHSQASQSRYGSSLTLNTCTYL